MQLQRQADDKFRRDLLEMERDRAKNERESLTTIAAAIIGQVAGKALFEHRNNVYVGLLDTGIGLCESRK